MHLLQNPAGSRPSETAGRNRQGVRHPNRDKVGKVTEEQVEEIAKQKMPDLNAHDLAGAVAIVKGTARSMGIEVVN